MAIKPFLKMMIAPESASWKSWGLLVLRLGFGLPMILLHGIPKIVRFEQLAPIFPDPLGIGSAVSLALVIFAEVGCSAALILGLFTRFSFMPLMFNFSVAAFVIHAGDPLAKKELALLYLFVYMCIFLVGPGHYSVDSAIQSKIE